MNVSLLWFFLNSHSETKAWYLPGSQHAADKHVVEFNIFQVVPRSLGLLQPDIRQVGVYSLTWVEEEEEEAEMKKK